MTALRTAAYDQAAQIRDALRCGRSGCLCRGGQVHCPAHADRRPSFTVSVKGDRLLVHCFSGCSQQAVLEALRERGLWARAGTKPLQSAKVPKRVPSGHARCPDCGHYMWWPTADHPGAWWCEDCARFVLKGDARIEYYEFPPVPNDLDRRNLRPAKPWRGGVQ
jgi:hypothetical protein